MTDDISYAALAGVPAETLHALLTAHAATALAEHQDPGWPRDRALWDAVDAALAEAAALAGPTRDAAAPAATARRRWLDGLVARELATLSTHFWATERFRRVRLLERLGLVTLTPDDTYVLAMVSGLGPDAAEVLREDPELVERALWRVFEVEGGGEVSLANVDKFGGDQWRRTFLQLCADGTLDRARVLDACLSVLTRDFSAYRAGWFSRTHLALVPTDDELTRAQGTLRRLLGAEVPATVAFAVKLLSRIRKTGDLAAEETLDALPPATLVKTKGTALAALRLAQRLLTDHPEMGTRTTLVARTALGHPDADVQRAAALLLTACGESDTVTAAADDLDPRARADLGLGVEVVATPDAPRVQRLLPPADPVRAADLADRTAGLLEDASDAREVEAVLAALVSPDAAEALAPLRKRARTVAGRGSRTPHGAAWLPGQVARLVLDLLGEPVAPATPDTVPQRFVVQRFLEVAAHRPSLTAPLLATPDLPGGWVSPETLARRLANQPHPRHHDLVAALLRLAPEGRAEALAAGSDLPPAVRFALGDPPGNSCDQRPGPAAWWRAAERSRTAYAPDELPTLDSQVRSFTWEEGGRQRRGWYARFTVATAPALAARADDDAADDDPTTVLLPVPERGFATRVGGCTGDWIPTLAALWPQDAEHFLTLTCLPVLQAPDGQVDHDVPRTLDALAQHPGRLGPLAAAALAAGLSAGIRQHRLHASDAFVDLAPSGRIGLPEVADVMARHAPAWPATRWAQSLGDVAEAPGGAGAVVDLLTLLLPRLPADHRRVGALLDLLRSLLLRSGRQVDDPELTKWLATFSGSSAAARSARQLREGVRP